MDVPVVANGDIKNEEDIQRVAEMTNVDGMYHNIIYRHNRESSL